MTKEELDNLLKEDDYFIDKVNNSYHKKMTDFFIYIKVADDIIDIYAINSLVKVKKSLYFKYIIEDELIDIINQLKKAINKYKI